MEERARWIRTSLGMEADRLGTRGRLEREHTQELLAHHLPPAPATVLDVGGGPRVYAVWLAGRGYAVRLLDPVELHVAQALELSALARRPAGRRRGRRRARPAGRRRLRGRGPAARPALPPQRGRRPPRRAGRGAPRPAAYFHRPDEFAGEVRAAGFALEALVALEGVGAFLADAANAWLDDPVRREPLLRAIRRLEAEPALLGASPHVLAVGRPPAAAD